MRPLLPENAEELFSAHREAFADTWGEGEETYEDFRHHLLDRPEFDPELWFLAWHGRNLPPTSERRRMPPRIRCVGVDLLGVRRAYRRRGIGEALLRHAFQALFRRGKGGCDLHVDADSLTGALRLYERVGMRAHPRFATWEKEPARPRGRLLKTGEVWQPEAGRFDSCAPFSKNVLLVLAVLIVTAVTKRTASPCLRRLLHRSAIPRSKVCQKCVTRPDLRTDA